MSLQGIELDSSGNSSAGRTSRKTGTPGNRRSLDLPRFAQRRFANNDEVIYDTIADVTQLGLIERIQRLSAHNECSLIGRLSNAKCRPIECYAHSQSMYVDKGFSGAS